MASNATDWAHSHPHWATPTVGCEGSAASPRGTGTHACAPISEALPRLLLTPLGNVVTPSLAFASPEGSDISPRGMWPAASHGLALSVLTHADERASLYWRQHS